MSTCIAVYHIGAWFWWPRSAYLKNLNPDRPEDLSRLSYYLRLPINWVAVAGVLTEVGEEIVGRSFTADVLDVKVGSSLSRPEASYLRAYFGDYFGPSVNLGCSPDVGEGRHRMVQAWLAGADPIPVFHPWLNQTPRKWHESKSPGIPSFMEGWRDERIQELEKIDFLPVEVRRLNPHLDFLLTTVIEEADALI